MQNYSLEFHFSWDSTLDFTTTDIVTDSIRVTEQRFNNLRSSSSTINLDINPDDGLLYQRLLRSNEGDIRAKLYAGSSLIFTGYVSRNLSWEVSSLGSSPVALSIESTGTRKLQKKLAQEDGVGVYDTPYNIIDNICTLCGITFDDSDINSTDNPELYVSVVRKVERSETCEDLLDDLLFELGYVDWFDATGALRLQKINLESTPVQITEDDLYEVQGNAITLTSQARQYTSATVKYSEMRTRQNVNVYQVDTSSNYITLDNISSLWWDGEYHDSVETPAPATVDMTDIDAGQTILWFDSSSLVATMTPVTGATAAQPAPTLIHRLTPDTSYPYRGTDKVDVLIDNTTALKPLVAYSAFAAKGTVITVDENTVMTAKDGSFTGSDYEYEYETSWIHDKTRAEALSVRMAKYNLYCNSTYNFYTKENIPLGSVVTVTDTTFAHASVTLFITGRTYTHYWFQDEPCYRYVGQAISSLISQFVPSTSSSGSKQQFLPNSYTYIRYSEYADGHDMVETPTADTKYIGTYSGPSAYCPSYTEFKWSKYASDDIQFFDIEVNPVNPIKNQRITGDQLVTVNCLVSGYTGTPTITVWRKGQDESDPDVALTGQGYSLEFYLPYNITEDALMVRAELTGAPTIEIEVPFIDQTETLAWWGHLAIDTQAYYPNGVFDASQFSNIDWSPIDDLLPAGERFLEGDSFFNDFTSGNFTDAYIYSLENNRWIPLSYTYFSNSLKSQICARAQKDVLSTIQPGTISKSDYGYFNDIIAGTVTADFIGSKEIELQSGGIMYGGDVDLTQDPGRRVGAGAGFCFDSLGNAEMSNIRITGDSTIEGGSTVLGTIINYDSANSPVFKTVKESEANISFSGSKTDGTNSPNAYLWNEFYSAFNSDLASHMSSGTTYSGSGTIYGTWSGSSISSSNIVAARYFSSAPSSTDSTTKVNCSYAYDQDESKTIWTNPYPYKVKFYKVVVRAKSSENPGYPLWGGPVGWGTTYAAVYTSGGALYQEIYSLSQGTGRGGPQLATINNVEVPVGGYIYASWGEGKRWWITNNEENGYVEMHYRESDNFTQGINLVIPGGAVYNVANVILNTASFSTYPQSISLPNASVSINIAMSAGSSWPVEKYYRFTYSTAPSTSATVTSSIFQSQSFSYRGTTKTIVSVTYSNSYLKAIASDGNVYEFTTASGNYYPRHSFSFTTLSESLGAYARSVLPTDDPNTHNIGAASTYDSGNPQRWDTGYFKSLDVLEGMVVPSVNAGWHVETISADKTLTEDFVVGSMRPYYVMSGGASGPTITMPGNSSQSYTVFSFRYSVAVVAGASCVARDIVAGGGSLSTSGYVSAAQPWCLLFVLRTA